jgi:hypothetical protein
MVWLHHVDLFGIAVANYFIGIQRHGSFRGLRLGPLAIGWSEEAGRWRFGLRRG